MTVNHNLYLDYSIVNFIIPFPITNYPQHSHHRRFDLKPEASCPAASSKQYSHPRPKRSSTAASPTASAASPCPPYLSPTLAYHRSTRQGCRRPGSVAPAHSCRNRSWSGRPTLLSGSGRRRGCHRFARRISRHWRK